MTRYVPESMPPSAEKSSTPFHREQAEWPRSTADIALESVWVLPAEASFFCVPLLVKGTPGERVLHCRLETEAGRIQEWHCALSSLQASSAFLSVPEGWQCFALPIPDPVEPGYHTVSVSEAHESISMRLIVAPTQCYCPHALAAGSGNRLWGFSVELPRVVSQTNWGIGDLGDLNRLIDWSAAQGADFVRVASIAGSDPFQTSLPLQHFLFLDVTAIEDLAECAEARKLVFNPTFQNELKKMREATGLSVREVANQKLEVLHLLYRSFTRNHLKKNSFRAHSFRTFIQKQGKRLEAFALYAALQEAFEREEPGVRDWRKWPEAYHHPNSPAVLEFVATNQERIGFYQYLQWQVELQLHAAGLRSLEHALGIGLCFDFGWGERFSPPDVWANPELFSGSSTSETLPALNLEALRQQGYKLFIDMARQAMQHAGAIQLKPLEALFEPASGDGARSRQALIQRELLGILALESHRHHCLIIGELFSTEEMASQATRQTRQEKQENPPHYCPQPNLPAQNDSIPMALERDVKPETSGHLFNKTIGHGEAYQHIPHWEPAKNWRAFPEHFLFEPHGEHEPIRFHLEEVGETCLLSVRESEQATLAEFWEGRDMICQVSDAPKGSLTAAIENRMRIRMALLQHLASLDLLPPGVTLDPFSTPQMTPALSAAIHYLVASAPAALFVVQLADVLLPETERQDVDALPEGAVTQYPIPLEQWWCNESLLTLCENLGKERPCYRCPPVEEVLPGLTSDQRTSLLTPRAIYRLQLNRDFTFRDAANLVPYLNRLGISHCYVSPLLRARPGSPHGYDITDHQQLNPDIGTLENFRHLADRLRMHGMGMIVDIVPNHMGAGKDNPWWVDVLENGTSSLYAEYFDIDWNPLSDDLQRKILLAILGDSYGKILENGEIRLQFNPDTGRFWLHYWEHEVPIDPVSYPVILGHRLEVLETRLGHNDGALLEYRSLLSAFENLPVETGHDFQRKEERARERTIAINRLISLCQQTPEILQFIEENVQDFQPSREHPPSLRRMNRLLEKQNYRLANWRVASDEINYRRFFDINDLIAVRVEDERVFQDTHRLLMNLVEERLIQGFRVDHPDGLYDPAQYFKRLQTETARRLGLPERGDWRLGSPELPLYILIEKILAPFERLPEDWAVHGTTGYEFMNSVGGLFIRQDSEKELTRIYEKFIGERVDFDELCYESKKLIMKTALNSELGVLTYQLYQISKAHWETQDFTLHNLHNALMEVVACFPVYRTYVADGKASRKDREYIGWAIRSAKRKNLSTDASVFDFLHSVLLAEATPQDGTESLREAVVHFAMKFQQYSSPVMAKGVEDTAFYRYNRLASLNEVGGDPKQFGCSVAQFHYQNLERLKTTPHTLLATSTHDTKRSEDVRARLAVLSEIPDDWAEHVNYWRRANRPFRKNMEEGFSAPSPNDEYLFYQTLLGIWPLHEPSEQELNELTNRIEAYMLKAVREAKVHSSWMNPNNAYEAALSDFVRNVLLRPSKLFLEDFMAFHKDVARFGALNSLSQTVLKLTVPGVPDVYQGTELFSFTLVDPDNRRPVDFPHCLQLLRQIDDMLESHEQEAFHQQLEALYGDLSDSRLKQFFVSSVLHFRSAQPGLFGEGNYIPLEVTGAKSEHLIAFARCWQEFACIVAAPRFFTSLGLRKKERPCGRRVWRDTRVILPEFLAGRGFRNLFERTAVTPGGEDARSLSVADILQVLPVGLLVAD